MGAGGGDVGSGPLGGRTERRPQTGDLLAQLVEGPAHRRAGLHLGPLELPVHLHVLPRGLLRAGKDVLGPGTEPTASASTRRNSCSTPRVHWS